ISEEEGRYQYGDEPHALVAAASWRDLHHEIVDAEVVSLAIDHDVREAELEHHASDRERRSGKWKPTCLRDLTDDEPCRSDAGSHHTGAERAKREDTWTEHRAQQQRTAAKPP